MDQQRLASFINSLDPGNIPLLDSIEEEALRNRVPIIRKETQALLKFLINSFHPVNILEIGAAVGFSSILMSAEAGEKAHITTIENYEKRIPVARENIKRAGFEERITLLTGNAEDILPTLEPGYDFIFIDAAKAQYPYYLQETERLLIRGGLMAADNCLQDGDILESRYAVMRRDRTIHKRMREFLTEVRHSDKFSSVILPTGDGVTLAVKK